MLICCFKEFDVLTNILWNTLAFLTLYIRQMQSITSTNQGTPFTRKFKTSNGMVADRGRKRLSSLKTKQVSKVMYGDMIVDRVYRKIVVLRIIATRKDPDNA